MCQDIRAVGAHRLRKLARYTGMLCSARYSNRAIRDQGRLSEAAKLLRTDSEGMEEHLGAAHVATCAAQAELADLEREQGDVTRAEAFALLANLLAEQLGNDHPEARAARINVALFVACRGKLAEATKLLDAETCQQQGVRGTQQKMPWTHPRLAGCCVRVWAR